MRASRYRLRFVTGVSFSAATYGSSTYGGPITYGQRASDPATDYRYAVVPLPAGYLAQPAWIRRHGDVAPALEAQILARSDPLDLATVVNATMLLTPTDGRELAPIPLPLEIDAPTSKGIVIHDWSSGNDVPAGTYRAVFVLITSSGRRLSLPGDDNMQLVITPAYQSV